jgi:ATP-dependent helicase/nuclease subunit A
VLALYARMGGLMAAPYTPEDPAVAGVLQAFGLTADQRRAAAARGQDIVVTAGAGSGKTRTLVARYLSLLAEGCSPRRVTAITFTEKAAREMRSRVRAALAQQFDLSFSSDQRQQWSELEAQLDAARIGTIHSLCAEILRAHPAEACIDPRFTVLDEGLAAALRAQAVADTLAWLVGEADNAPLLDVFTTTGLQTLLAFLLEQRLEVQALYEQAEAPADILRQALVAGSSHPALAAPLDALRRLQSEDRLRQDAGEPLADQVTGLLETWARVEGALAAGRLVESAGFLFQARRQMSGGTGKRTGAARQGLTSLRTAYDEVLDPWLGGRNAKDPPPDETLESLFLQSQPRVRLAFERLLQTYQAALRQRQALDFDDLEAGAACLLSQPGLRIRWQGEMDALLVDEFQDTNARQREIIQALCGETPGRLFVVGDARQSIYRFRRADVTVFRRLQQEIQARGGLVVDLDLTYRAHAPLLLAAGDLLAGVMGVEPDPQRPYHVPFSPLRSDRDTPGPTMQSPHVELVLGGGENAGAARPLAAQALALRLHELRQAGQIQRWDEVALLFRASTGFQDYEEAFEAAGVPFVTVAGRGFYDRPEIRDVLNLLRALADPWDDLAMAGLLRSPAFGLSDAALYRLRWQAGRRLPYWSALQGGLESLDEPDRAHARRALDLLGGLQPLVDRLPVAELLKRLVDGVDYRAILATAQAAGSRLWRNLDKLLADAQASGLVSVRAFLEYLDTLRDVGAREGEAPAEAEGAVRLMSIHKAKGLEFPLVVLADAARQRRNTRSAAYLLPETGLVYRLDHFDTQPLLYRLAHLQDIWQSEEEEKRLLYVALTRAREKLLISGHCTPRSGGWSASGWLGSLAEAGRVDLGVVIDGSQPMEAATLHGHALRLCALPADGAALPLPPPAAHSWPESTQAPLYHPLLPPDPEDGDPEPGETPRPWRATGERLRPPAEAVGLLVHHAIQRWLFPGDPGLPGLLETAALEAGLADPAQRLEAVQQAGRLLGRLQRHPLWQEIRQAGERYHEVPFTRMTAGGGLDTGYLDLLYRSAQGWQVIDFKSEALHSPAERQAAIARSLPQMRRYAQAARHLLRQPARVRLCFLDDEGRVSLEEVFIHGATG